MDYHVGSRTKHMSSSGSKVCFEKSKYIVYEPYLGLHLAYHAKRFCFSGRSKYQRIDIIDNDAYGRMLFLDNNLQHTTYDSRIFNEALCDTAKKNGVVRVVVLGGGSGQTVLALLESPSIEHVTVIEIDPLVIECCKKYVKGVNQAFRDPRVRILIGDAFKYLQSMNECFDASIIDLTERPFWVKSSLATLRQLYADVKEKCEGRCSQYIGSSVGLAYSGRLRSLIDSVSRQFLSNVRYEDVFIPSFGAPHTFMHAGYER
jgi:predicted membrane-bound spermidine synthase